MEQRVSLITLGVKDIDAAAAFYQSLGWQRAETPPGVVAFDLIGQTLGLYPLASLAEEIGLPIDQLGQGAMTLSYNSRTREEVAGVLDAARVAGAVILKPESDSDWGGHHGYFRAPDGHIWEVAFNPFSPLGPDGAFRWSGH